MFLFILWMYINKDKQGRRLNNRVAVPMFIAQTLDPDSPAARQLENS